MIKTKNSLWEKVSDADLATKEKPEDDNITPWFIKLLLGFAGWLGAIFLFASIGVTLFFIIDEWVTSIAFGLILCMIPIFPFRKRIKNDFLVQFLIAIALAGHGLIFYGLFDFLDFTDRSVFIVILIIQLVYFIFINSFILKVFASLTGIASLLFLISSVGLDGLIPGLLLISTYFLWSHEYKIPYKPIFFQSLGITLTALTIMSIFGDAYIWNEVSSLFISHRETTGPIALSNWTNILMIGATYFYLLKIELGLKLLLSIILTVFASFLAFFISGFVIMLPIVLIAFYHRNNLILFAGIMSSLTYISYYYYKMEITLLTKSIVLISLGTVFLVTRVILKKKRVL